MIRRALLICGVWGFTLGAWAIPTSLDIDFRSDTWAAADGQRAWTVDDVTVTSFFRRTALGYDADTGLGVDTRTRWANWIGDSPTEIDPWETLAVRFEGSSGVGLTGVWITQLFAEEHPGHPRSTERGFVFLKLSDSSTERFVFEGTDSGEYFVDFGGAKDIERAIFRAIAPFNSDYSVAGFVRGVSPPPPPGIPDGGSTLMLLGLALLGVAGYRKASA